MFHTYNMFINHKTIVIVSRELSSIGTDIAYYITGIGVQAPGHSTSRDYKCVSSSIPFKQTQQT